MCICINCRWVDRCETYHSVERQHGVSHLTHKPDLKPKNPKIIISVSDSAGQETEVEWDVRACESFLEDHGRWSRLCPGEKIPT